MKARAAFQLRSLGTRPQGASRTITAAATLITAAGGFGKAFSSVRFTWKSIIKESIKEYNIIYWERLQILRNSV